MIANNIPKVKTKKTPEPQKNTQALQASNTSTHESKVIPVRDPVFYDLVRSAQVSENKHALSLDILNGLYDAWKIGCDDVEAAQFVGVSYGAVTMWIREIPELKDIRDRVKSAPRVLAKKNVLNRLLNDPKGEFSLRYLEKVKPEEFGGKGAVININNTSISVSDKTTSLTEFMGTFGADIIDEDTVV